MSGGGVGARLGGAPFCNPKTDRVEAAAPAKSERERVTSGVKQGLGVRRRGRCLLEKVQGTMEVAQGGGGCSLTRGSLSLTQGVLDDGRSPRAGDPPSPRHGESNPDPQRAFSPGRAQLTGGTRLAAAREGHPALPTPLQGSAQTEGLRGLYRVMARDSAGPSRPAPYRRAGAQSGIVRMQDEPRRPQNLLKSSAQSECINKHFSRQ